MRNNVVALASIVLALVACKKESAPAPAPAPSASAVASAPPPAAPSAAPTAAGSEGKNLHCPSAVAGTNTAITDVPGGVAIVVTARDGADGPTIEEIRTRAAFLVDAAKSTPAAEHNGSGELGGRFGRCPVVMRATSVAAKDSPAGSTITVTARDPKEQDWLRRESRSRVDELSAPAVDESAHAKEVHCPTAVAGAKVAITDAPDGVSVAVSATEPAAAKEIRDRAHALVAAAALGQEGRAAGGGGTGAHKGGGGGKGAGGGDGTGGGKGDGTGGGKGDGTGAGGGGGGGGGGHNGQGSGGGFGNCPLVARGAAIDVADTADGVTVHLKAKEGTPVAELRQRVRDRAADAGLAR